METALAKLQLAIVAKPITSLPPVPTVSNVEAMFARHYPASAKPMDISCFPPDFILQFDDKTSYDTVLSYQILTDNNYTFSLAPWSDDARCQTQAWSVPVTIDIHSIPPHAFHMKSLSILLDPYCDIETYTMDQKKTSICTVEGDALDVNSIPTTGFLSYPRRSGYETVIHTFPVTMKTSLLSMPNKNTSDWQYHPCLALHPHEENSSHIKDQEKEVDSDMVREYNRAVFEAEIEDERRMKNFPTFHGFAYSGESSDNDDPNEAYYYADSDREPKNWLAASHKTT